jgi:hypothetical protein
MRNIMLIFLAGMFSMVAAADIIVGPPDGPASSYPFCGS